MEKTLTVIEAPRQAASAALAYVTDYSPLGDKSIDAIVDRAQLYAVLDGHRPVCWYALHIDAGLAWITGAVGHLPGIDLTRSVLPLIERQARSAGADRIGLSTQRRGLIKKLASMGYLISGPCGRGLSLEKDLQ